MHFETPEKYIELIGNGYTQPIQRYVLVPSSSCLPVNDNLNSSPFLVTKRNLFDLFCRTNGSKVTVLVIGLHKTLYHETNWKTTVSKSCSRRRRKRRRKKVRTSISFPSLFILSTPILTHFTKFTLPSLFT